MTVQQSLPTKVANLVISFYKKLQKENKKPIHFVKLYREKFIKVKVTTIESLHDFKVTVTRK